jgi:hypothetical protein
MGLVIWLDISALGYHLLKILLVAGLKNEGALHFSAMDNGMGIMVLGMASHLFSFTFQLYDTNRIMPLPLLG